MWGQCSADCAGNQQAAPTRRRRAPRTLITCVIDLRSPPSVNQSPAPSPPRHTKGREQVKLQWLQWLLHFGAIRHNRVEEEKASPRQPPASEHVRRPAAVTGAQTGCAETDWQSEASHRGRGRGAATAQMQHSASELLASCALLHFSSCNPRGECLGWRRIVDYVATSCCSRLSPIDAAGIALLRVLVLLRLAQLKAPWRWLAFGRRLQRAAHTSCNMLLERFSS